MNAPHAYFRLPGRREVFFVAQDGSSSTLSPSLSDSRPGFVFAPFHADGRSPFIFIRPDVFRQVSLPPDSLPPGFSFRPASPVNDLRVDYDSRFRIFHDALRHKRLQKVVLSRCLPLTTSSPVSPLVLFARACRRYPHLFVALVSSPASGSWLVATPELLLSSDGTTARTVALAGTRPDTSSGSDPSWGDKERHEQALVGDYIRSTLSPLAASMEASPLRTVRAAHLLHLSTSFSFRPHDGVPLSNIVTALHPTPAVCGLPPREALDTILLHEALPRRYYSGFLGPWQIHDTSGCLPAPTALYVSLRCMHIDGSLLRLYAGGGLLEASDRQSEWDETENKLNTMKQLLYV